MGYFAGSGLLLSCSVMLIVSPRTPHALRILQNATRMLLPQSHQVFSHMAPASTHRGNASRHITDFLCINVLQFQAAIRHAAHPTQLTKEAQRGGYTWTLGEARFPPCDGCTCLSLTLTCVDRPAELRSVIACRSTSSSDSFLTPTFLTVPFPAWLKTQKQSLMLPVQRECLYRPRQSLAYILQGCHGVHKRVTSADRGL